MDTTSADGGWYTLVCLADGATSIYTSGTIGVGLVRMQTESTDGR